MPARRLTDGERATVEANRGLVYVVVNAHFPADGPRRDDAIGWGYVGLIEAVFGYRPECGPFPKYACQCIANRVKSFKRDDRLLRLPKQRTDKRYPGAFDTQRNARLSPIEDAGVVAARTPDPDWPAELRDDIEALRRAMAFLSAESQIVVHVRSQGEAFREIGRRFSATGEWARLKWRRALTRLRWLMRVELF
jgi:RNA polymerase sigma factor (sigma-70 family)